MVDGLISERPNKAPWKQRWTQLCMYISRQFWLQYTMMTCLKMIFPVADTAYTSQGWRMSWACAACAASSIGTHRFNQGCVRQNWKHVAFLPSSCTNPSLFPKSPLLYILLCPGFHSKIMLNWRLSVKGFCLTIWSSITHISSQRSI